MFPGGLQYARILFILWMSYLGLGGTISDSREMSLHDATTVREPCGICMNDVNCKVVATVLVRDQMDKGYNFLATVPSGACNVTVMEKSKAENHLALRWTLDEDYYFNGGWMIQKTGNFTTGNNSFTYKHPDDFQDGNAYWETIKFTSQLLQKIDVFLLVKTNDARVEFNFVLPPNKNFEDRPTKTEAIHAAELQTTSGPVITEKAVEESKLQDDRRRTEDRANMEEFSRMQHAFIRMAGSVDTIPSWVSDFASILKEWKRQLDDGQRLLLKLQKENVGLRSRIVLLNETTTDLKTKADSTKTTLNDHQRQINYIKDKAKTDLEAQNARMDRLIADHRSCQSGLHVFTKTRKEMTNANTYDDLIDINFGRTFPGTPSFIYALATVGFLGDKVADEIGSIRKKSEIKVTNTKATINVELFNIFDCDIRWIACF